MSVDTFVGFKQRLANIDYTDLFGERTQQLKDIRKEAMIELGKRLNSDLAPTKLQQQHEEAFFKQLKEMLGSHPDNALTTAKDVQEDVKSWTAGIVNRISMWNEFISGCKQSQDVTTGFNTLPSSKDLRDRAKEISDEALEVLALSSNYQADRKKIEGVFTDVKNYSKLVTDVANYDDCTKVVAAWKQIEDAKEDAAKVALIRPSLGNRAKALVGGAFNLAIYPSKIPQAMISNPGTSLAVTAGAVALGAYVLPTLIAWETVKNLAIVGSTVFGIGVMSTWGRSAAPNHQVAF